MKNNTWTIMRKEFTRFFSDSGLFFTVVLMPGLLIFFIYTLIGDNMDKQLREDTQAVTTVYVDNMPEALKTIFNSLTCAMVTRGVEADKVKALIRDKDNDVAYMHFPEGFMDSIAAYDPAGGRLAPNVEIFYNDGSPNSSMANTMLNSVLDGFESSLSNRFDVNRADAADGENPYDMGDDRDVMGDLFGQLLTMLILMMLF